MPCVLLRSRVLVSPSKNPEGCCGALQDQCHSAAMHMQQQVLGGSRPLALGRPAQARQARQVQPVRAVVMDAPPRQQNGHGPDQIRDGAVGTTGPTIINGQVRFSRHLKHAQADCPLNPSTLHSVSIACAAHFSAGFVRSTLDAPAVCFATCLLLTTFASCSSFLGGLATFEQDCRLHEFLKSAMNQLP